MFKKSLLIFGLFVFISCGGRPLVLVPPEIDLLPYESIGLISFSVENAEGQLDEMATQRFLQDLTRFQRGVQIIELGHLDEVLGKINKSSLDHEAMSAIGEHFGVTSFFHGKIKVSDVKPDVDIATLLKSLSVRADQIPYFDVRDQDETYKILVERMVYELTRDFRPTKRRL
jgi:hypothetical protein